jgi:phosphoenolpyruvate synthase/pyruvate phosphate dikinase
MTSTKRFDEVGKDDLALTGGKSANPGELSRGAASAGRLRPSSIEP